MQAFETVHFTLHFSMLVAELLAFAEEVKSETAEACAAFCWDPENRQKCLRLAKATRSDYLEMAKAEQREADAKIAEGYDIGCFECGEPGQVIAARIRQGK